MIHIYGIFCTIEVTTGKPAAARRAMGSCGTEFPAALDRHTTLAFLNTWRASYAALFTNERICVLQKSLVRAMLTSRRSLGSKWPRPIPSPQQERGRRELIPSANGVAYRSSLKLEFFESRFSRLIQGMLQGMIPQRAQPR